MCTQPVYINSHSLIPRLAQTTNYFGCGRCVECQQLKKNDIYARLVCEYLTMKEYGFFTLFTTHTYRNDCVPFVPFTDITAFSKKDVELFIKRVHTQVNRFFKRKVKFKVFVVCEYGGANHRSHYHIMWFVELPKTLYFTKNFWNVVKSCWSFGWNYTSHKNNGVLLDSSAINYACKYIIKDIFTYQYMNDLNDYPQAQRMAQLGFLDVSKYLPFYKISNGVGLRYCQKYITKEQMIEGRFNIDARTSLVVPRYFVRKMCYDALSFHSLSPDTRARILQTKKLHSNFKNSSQTIYVLNDFGRDLKLSKYANDYLRWSVVYDRLYCSFGLSNTQFKKCASITYADFFKIIDRVFLGKRNFWFYLNFIRPYDRVFLGTTAVNNFISEFDIQVFHLYQPYSDEINDFDDFIIGDYSITDYLQQFHYYYDNYVKNLAPYGLSLTDLLTYYEKLCVQLNAPKLQSLRTTQEIMYNAKTYYYANES